MAPPYPRGLVTTPTPSQGVPWAKTLACCPSGLLGQWEGRPKLWRERGQVSMWPIYASVSLLLRSCPNFSGNRPVGISWSDLRTQFFNITLEKLATLPVLLCANPLPVLLCASPPKVLLCANPPPVLLCAGPLCLPPAEHITVILCANPPSALLCASPPPVLLCANPLCFSTAEHITCYPDTSTSAIPPA